MSRRMRLRWGLVGAVTALLVVSCTVAETKAPAGPSFRNAPESPLFVGPQAGRPEVGDVNGDGLLDIVVACGACCGDRHQPTGGHVVVLLGDGRGGMRDAEGSPHKVGPTARKVALGDVDGNGSLDIAVAEHDSNAVTILVNDGKGRFAALPTRPEIAPSSVRPHTHAIAIADVNVDGKSDLIATSANAGAIAVMLGDGKGGFAHAAGSPMRVGRHPYDAIAIGDLNGDGKPDIVTPDMHGNAIVALLGSGSGTFAHAPGSPVAVDQRPGYVAIGDVNRDGNLDAIASHDDYGILDILLGDGTGRLTPAPGSPIRVALPIWGLTIADINGDWCPDIVGGVAGGRNVLVFWNDGKGGFAEERTLRSEAGDGAGHLSIADLNRDGRPDIVTGNYDSGDVSILINNR